MKRQNECHLGSPPVEEEEQEAQEEVMRVESEGI